MHVEQLKPGAAETAGSSRRGRGTPWAEHHPSASARTVLSSRILRLAYNILNRVLKALSLRQQPIVLHN